MKKSSYLKYSGINSLNRLAMLQMLPVNVLKWFEETPQFNKDS